MDKILEERIEEEAWTSLVLVNVLSCVAVSTLVNVLADQYLLKEATDTERLLRNTIFYALTLGAALTATYYRQPLRLYQYFVRKEMKNQ